MSDKNISERPAEGPKPGNVKSTGVPEQRTSAPPGTADRAISPVSPKDSPPLQQQGEGGGPLHRRHV